jgi:hypothetical protein
MSDFITREGNGRARMNVYRDGSVTDAGMDFFDRGLCLLSDVTMQEGTLDIIVEIIRRHFE